MQAPTLPHRWILLRRGEWGRSGSARPVPQKNGEFSQQNPLLSEHPDALDGIGRQLGDEGAGAVHAHVAHESGRGRAARALAGLGGRGLLEEVVHDLEREADVARVRTYGCELLLARAAEHGTELGRRDEERARLAGVDRLETV